LRCVFSLSLTDFMPVDQTRCNDVLQKLGRQLTKAAKKPSPTNVHKLRIQCRRVETVLDRLVPAPDRNTKKLIKLLTRLRQKAGNVRDLDVQIDALRGLKISTSAHKSLLLKSLCSEREERQKKFAQNLNRDTRLELRRRLKRTARKIEIPEGMEPLSAALEEFGDLDRDRAPLSANKLHQYRIAGKRARYLVEMAQETGEAGRVMAQLKRMQDVVGDWRDWTALTERGETLFGSVKDSALVAAMRNLTRAKFRQALDAVSEAKSVLARERVGLVRIGGALAKRHEAHAASGTAAAA
jgi:CHAD domain-containing protein